MEKLFIILKFLSIQSYFFSQADYDQGFKVGYKEGYCYNDIGCIPPVTPITPILNVGESIYSYQDGYNRGFKTGIEDKQTYKNNISNYGNNNSGKRSSSEQPHPQQYVSQYVPIDFKSINSSIERWQAANDQNQKYINSLINWIFDLKSKTNDKSLLDALDMHYKVLRQFDGKDLAIMNKEIRDVELGIKEDVDKYNTRIKEAPSKFWDSGNENMKNKNYAQAIQDFTNLIQLRPEFALAYRNRGYVYQSLGNFSLSLNDLNKSIELKSDDAFTYSARGWSKYYLKDFMGALNDFNKQIDLDPSSATGYYNRGSAKSELGDQNGAILDYTKSIELKPNYSMSYNNRGWAKYQMKKYSEALIDLNKSIEFGPNNWIAYDSRQEIKFMLNDIKGCIADCMTAIQLNPKCANSYFYLGRCNYKDGLKKIACENWSKAGELGKVESYEYISKYCNK